MPTRQNDEIMADFLLKGGKMLDKACPHCGSPLFEVNKKVLCVVCAEREKEREMSRQEEMSAEPVRDEERSHRCTCHHEEIYDDKDGTLQEELIDALHILCRRVQSEENPERCLTLLSSVKVGIEALKSLSQI